MKNLRRKIFLAGLILVFIFLPLFTELQAEKTEEETIVFRVKIVADKSYQKQRQDCLECGSKDGADWQKDIIRLIKEINKDFRAQNVKVRLAVEEISSWSIEEGLEKLLPALDDLMNKVYKGDFDLIIGITAKDFPAENQAGGYYSNPGYVLVRDSSHLTVKDSETIPDDKWTLISLKHEIGHFFGLHHSDDSQSIMYNKIRDWSAHCQFTEEEIKIINKNAPEAKRGKSGLYR